MSAKDHFAAQFKHLDNLFVEEFNYEEDMMVMEEKVGVEAKRDSEMLAFLSTSIEFLIKLYDPETASRILRNFHSRAKQDLLAS